MKKILLAGLFLLAFPILTMAQSADVDTSGQTVTTSCVNLANNIRYRMRDANTNDEVSALQDFLNVKGFLSSEPTGFFGIATLKAVKKYQSFIKLSPTGYVGQLTRAKIKDMTCIASTNPATTTTTPQTPSISPASPPSPGSKPPEGCASFAGYSTLTGNRCFPLEPGSIIFPTGCTSAVGFSPTTGNSCSVTVKPAAPTSSNLYWFDPTDKTCQTQRQFFGSYMYLGLQTFSSQQDCLNAVSSQAPTISLLSPTSGPVGQMVVVKGDNFTGNETVYFGGYKVKAEKNYLSYITSNVTSSGMTTAPFDGYIFNVPALCPDTNTTCIPVSIANPNVYQVQVVNANGKSNTVPFTVTTPAPTSLITVLSPNGGETWTKGTNQTIIWQVPPPIACLGGLQPNGSYIACAQPAPTMYDITLISYIAPCPAGVLCTTMMLAPISIAKSVHGSSYNWLVDSGLPEGAWTMQVCQSGTSICDSSNSYFKIVSGVVTATTTPAITVLSPNGGETWTKGTTQAIKWQDSNPPSINCPVGATCTVPVQSYDIQLIPYSPPCPATSICTMIALAPYTINKNVVGQSYSWSVGKIVDMYGTGAMTALDGAYTVQVCNAGITICDSSDSYFKVKI